MDKIIGLLRASTDHQDIESQKEALLGYLKKSGWKEEQIIWMGATGASARGLNKIYTDFLESIKTRILGDPDIKALSMWSLDRLGRVDTVILQMRDFFIDHHIQVFIQNGGLTLFSDTGELRQEVFILWNIFAGQVRIQTSELMAKLQRGRDHRRSQGKWMGGSNPPYGYSVSSGYLIQEPSEIENIKEIFRLYSTGKYSTQGILLELTERGVTFRGGSWKMGTLGLILRRKSYRDIVGTEIFDKTQSILSGNRAKFTTKESKKHRLGISLIKCPDCGGNYYADSERYRCYRRANPFKFEESKRCTGSSPGILISVLDKLIKEVSFKWETDHRQALKELDIEKYREEMRITQEKLDNVPSRMEEIERKLGRAKKLYIDGSLGDLEWKEYKEEAEASRKRINDSAESWKRDLLTYTRYITDWEKPDPVSTLLDTALETGKDRERAIKYISEINLSEDQGFVKITFSPTLSGVKPISLFYKPLARKIKVFTEPSLEKPFMPLFPEDREDILIYEMTGIDMRPSLW